MTVKTSDRIKMFPTGEYKTIFYLTDRKEDEIAVVNIIGDVNSPLKESFG